MLCPSVADERYVRRTSVRYIARRSRLGPTLLHGHASIASWLTALRPISFTASIIPVLVGTAIAAEDEFHPLLFVLALLGSIAIHAGTNLVNDYFDHVKGTDNEESLGQSGVIQRGLLSARAVLAGGIVAFAVGAAIGLVITAQVGWPVLALGVASVLAGYFYTASPFSLAYRGLGEVVVFVFMGPVIVVGAYYVQTEAWGWEPIRRVACRSDCWSRRSSMPTTSETSKTTVAPQVDACRAGGAADRGLRVRRADARRLRRRRRHDDAGARRGRCSSLCSRCRWRCGSCGSRRAQTSPRALNLVLAQTAGMHMIFGALLAFGFALAVWTGLG